MTQGNAIAAESPDKTGGWSGEEHRSYTIGDLAKEFGVSLRALRFYEDRGLLTPTREGARRVYFASDRLRLQMILKGKRLGFTLTEISALLTSPDNQSARGDFDLHPDLILAQVEQLERQRAELDHAIAELRARHRQINHC